MICRKQPPYPLKENIASVIEVLFNFETWNQIKIIRKRSSSTFSWVVRFCIFGLLDELQNHKIDREQRDESQSLAGNRKTGHRLQLCLYGDDEKQIKLAALELRISIADLIRIAIMKYLPVLQKMTAKSRKQTKKYLVEHATKKVKLLNESKIFEKKQLKSKQFDFFYYPRILLI